MKIIRVFPRKTSSTPNDDLVRLGPPDLFEDGADEIHISVAFTADLPKADYLEYQWQGYAKIIRKGGPAYGQRSEEFVPGMYIKQGHVITSRGCPRLCWFCDVWKRENNKPGDSPRELPICNGWNILDDNLLACSRPHVEAVFAMLRKQHQRVRFTGGLEAAALQDYQVGLLADLKPRPQCYFAYDPGDHFDTLKSAAERLISAGFTARSHRLSCYVLIGYPKDTKEQAECRLRSILSIGFTPYAMLWQPTAPAAKKWAPDREWRSFQRMWVRQQIIHSMGATNPVA